MPPIKVGDVDRQSGKIVLRDTKNRSDHKLLLSKQALEIVASNRLDRKADELVFLIVDARKTLAWINAQAGTAVQGHGARRSRASHGGSAHSSHTVPGRRCLPSPASRRLMGPDRQRDLVDFLEAFEPRTLGHVAKTGFWRHDCLTCRARRHIAGTCRQNRLSGT